MPLDLYTGEVYASFQVTADGEGTDYDIVLNHLGRRDMQRAIDDGEQFFSVSLANTSFDSGGYFSPNNAKLIVSIVQSEP